MKLIVRRIDGHKLSMISGIFSGIVTLLFIPIFLLTVLANPEAKQNDFLILFLFLPILYFVVGYLFTRLFCFIFNVISNKLKGFYIEVENIESLGEKKEEA